MKHVLLIFLVGLGLFTPLFPGTGYGEYTEWDLDTARRILFDSPWCSRYSWVRNRNTQYYQHIEDSDQNVVVHVDLQLFSAHPIRQALTVVAAGGNSQLLQKWREFATRDFTDEIVVSWTMVSEPKGSSVLFELQKRMNSLTLSELRSETALSTNSGRKVSLKGYIPPTPDGTGAKFIFPRYLPDGSPLVREADTEIRFQVTPIRLISRMKLEASRPGNCQTMGISPARAMAEDQRDTGNELLGVSVSFKLPELVYRGNVDF